MYVNEFIDFTIVETEVDVHGQYIGVKLQLPNKDGIKWTERVSQRLRDVDGNNWGTDIYRGWEHHTEYEI